MLGENVATRSIAVRLGLAETSVYAFLAIVLLGAMFVLGWNTGPNVQPLKTVTKTAASVGIANGDSEPAVARHFGGHYAQSQTQQDVTCDVYTDGQSWQVTFCHK